MGPSPRQVYWLATLLRLVFDTVALRPIGFNPFGIRLPAQSTLRIRILFLIRENS